jgi:LysR family glycine cleavage system transcriptional activator
LAVEAAVKAAASGAAQRLRVTMLPSFANRWLLPRMARWRERHPQMALEIDATPQIVDLQREGFHAALRQGIGPWAGLTSERLFDKPMNAAIKGHDIGLDRRSLPLPATLVERAKVAEHAGDQPGGGHHQQDVVIHAHILVAVGRRREPCIEFAG